MNIGTVYLIGAGPGDPGLITVRGSQLLRTADVIVYDRLAHPSLLNFAKEGAECVYVGKASSRHAMRQPDINALLVDRALQGKSVARLKGGDPFVFGRGGEEAEACLTAGVRFEIVPGVTSAVAAPAYAGIPVTHRDTASSFAVITGHERDDAPARDSAGLAELQVGEAEGRRNWATLAHAADTLVFLMGVEALPEISARLIENGRDPGTPVALIQWGTWTRQRVVTGSLSTIVDEVKRAGLTPPAVCVVGNVVALRAKLRWFDDAAFRPLFGKRILVTRAREQASALSEMLRQRGAEPVEFPAIRIQGLDDYVAVDAAIRQLAQYAWVIFTSANAVTAFAARLAACALDGRAFAGSRIAAIGPATGRAVFDELGLRADLVPEEAVAEAVLDALPADTVAGARVLLPRAEEAREVLPEGLRQRGARVDVVPVYRTVLDGAGVDGVREALCSGEIDVITFTSSSTVRNFAQAVAGGDSVTDLRPAIGRAIVAAIGPITADTARSFGLEPDIVAPEHTIPGLVASLENHLWTT